MLSTIFPALAAHNHLLVRQVDHLIETLKKEHIRNVKNCQKDSNIAKHAWDNDHRIDFDNAEVLDWW